MTALPLRGTQRLGAWLDSWRRSRFLPRGVLGRECPTIQGRGGPAVDLFGVVLAGRMPQPPVGLNCCALLAGGTCDDACRDALRGN